MKILMVNRADALTNYGGDTTQMLETQKELKKVGISVDLAFGSQSKRKYRAYDIIHFFNLQTAQFIYNEILKVKKLEKPFVLSTIWWDFHDDYLSSMGDVGNSKLLDLLTKNLVLNAYKLNLKISVQPKQKFILDAADFILPNSNAEVHILKERFKDLDLDNISVVPNGVSRQFLLENDYELPVELKKLNLCSNQYALQVGRIESGKNVLTTIKLCKEMDIPLVLIGKQWRSKFFKSYFNKYMKTCKVESGENTYFLGPIDNQSIMPFYQHAKIHVLPSIRETPGLTNLEAGVLGCNVVTTEIGSTQEYFKDLAYYCNPKEYDSIGKAIEDAWNSKKNSKLKERIARKYTWEKAAKITLDSYDTLMNEF
ncbi:glycosyltransferase [Methanobacterium formicicum]|jgi:glycosyltransferase involved in cell wall biosynthesis|uniref:Glycosyl transferase family 1 domain-containing protein n=1 Tax=Methanobacterium formicicum TaxID=2162 RepID=A0A0S4FQ64_METFO|nr:glycosyltransferase [Methanobacterium formicicum]CEL25133.1 hypothetical protein MB9_1497 [Methanobacterium formicicum]